MSRFDTPEVVRSFPRYGKGSSANLTHVVEEPKLLRSLVGLGCAKTPAVAPHVEISPSNCIPKSQIILHTRASMPCWRIVFSTFYGCMSFYTWGNSGIEPHFGSGNQLSGNRSR